jgi:U3 small nucleolar RNA-associated protein 4
LISSAISEDGNYIAISDLYETKLFTLKSSETEVKAIRIKSFLNTLSTSKHISHLDIASKGLGSSTLAFTPDSRRLVMGHVQSGNIIVVSLPSPDSDEGEGVEVIKSFQMGGNVVHGRVIVGGKKRRRNGRKNGIDPESVTEVEVVDDMEVDEKEGEDDEEADEEKEDVKEEVAQKEEEQSWISCLGASGDGQWLVSGDTAGRVTIFNLDTLQVSPIPTFQHHSSILRLVKRTRWRSGK